MAYAEIVTMGELLIDFVSTAAGVSIKDSPGFTKAAGGAPANVAVGVRRLGRSSAFMGKVGNDEFGHFLAETLRREGVDTSAIRYDESARTALAFVSLGTEGEREFVFYRHPSADMLLRPDEINMDLVRGACVFHHGSISLINEPARSATQAAIAAARDSGVFVSYDPNLRLPLWPNPDEARAVILSAVPTADLIKVSEEELAFLTGIAWSGDGTGPEKRTGTEDWTETEEEPEARGAQPREPAARPSEVEARLSETVVQLREGEARLSEAAARLWEAASRSCPVVVTRGKRGCALVTDEIYLEVPGFKVPAVDTTGAGDAFVAGLLVGLLDMAERGLLLGPGSAHGESGVSPISLRDVLGRLRADEWREVLCFANGAGALCTMKKGAIPALPTRKELTEFLSTGR